MGGRSRDDARFGHLQFLYTKDAVNKSHVQNQDLDVSTCEQKGEAQKDVNSMLYIFGKTNVILKLVLIERASKQLSIEVNLLSSCTAAAGAAWKHVLVLRSSLKVKWL